MTNDEAKTVLQTERDLLAEGQDGIAHALDIALWSLEALPHLLTAIEDYDDIEAVDAAKEWLQANPRPGSER